MTTSRLLIAFAVTAYILTAILAIYATIWPYDWWPHE